MNKSDRVVLLLAAYDYESLHLTLEALTHTLDADEQVVIVLNGKRGIRSALVEDVSRGWAKGHAHRHVVKPLNYGKDAYTSISQVIASYPVIQQASFICKIDDDLIPLKAGWVDHLHAEYLAQEKEHSRIGFVTSLINNNSWGFKQLVRLFDKESEYKDIMNFASQSGTGLVPEGEIADGNLGSVWQYPYLAKWVHEWTLCDTHNFIAKTKDLGTLEIDLATHYSIGCLFFRKELWLSLTSLHSSSNFDELLIHQYCQRYRLRKFAVMSQPMGHLFYFVQRLPNRLQLPLIKESLASYWDDNVFRKDFVFDTMTTTEIALENHFWQTTERLADVQYNLEVISKSSFYYKTQLMYRRAKSIFSKSGVSPAQAATASADFNHPAAMAPTPGASKQGKVLASVK